jgi:iron complex outermembrane receptor protein
MFKEKSLALSLRIAFGTSVAGLALVSASASAQEVQQGERVEVTGSSIKRIEGESALPVTVIKRDELDKLGVTTAAELLDRISANNGGGYNATLALGDAGRPGFSGASLRGLGSTNTLILLNGRRLAVYAFDGGGVNLSSIPLAVIQRVEILRDGASAVYGSDAIGGVINFITNKDFTGGIVETEYASTDNRGGNYGSATATIGFGDLATNGFNVFGTFDWRKQGSIPANARSFSSSAYIPTEGVNRLSSNSIPANVSTSSGLLNPYAPRFVGRAASCSPPASFGTTSTDGRCRFDYASVIDIFNPTETASAFLRATVALGANNQLFFEGLHSESRYKFAISPDPVSEATTFNGDPVLYPVTGRYYPGNGITPAIPGVAANTGGYAQGADLYWRSLAAGPRTDITKEKDDRVLIGAEGTVLGWDYNVGLMRTQNKVTDSYTDGWLSESKLLRTGGLTPKQPGYSAAVLAAGGIDPNINPFSVAQTAAGQAALDAAKINQVVREGKSSRDSVDGRASRELFNLPAGPLAIAVGAEFQKQKYDDIPSAIFQTGDIIGSGGDLQPVSADRRVTSAFTELSIPIIRNLDAGLAARFDHYSDFGNTTNPKVTLRFQPIPEVLLRASAGTGFRAPTLPELYTGQTQTNSGGVYNDPLYDSSAGFTGVNPVTGANGRCASPTGFNGQYCSAQLKIKQGGNAALQPEKSHQFSTGFLLEPTRNFSFGADYFYIKQRQQIGIINGDTKLEDYIADYNPVTRTSSSVYAGDIVTKFDPLAGTTVIDYTAANYANVAEQVTSGIDFSVKLRLPETSFGQFTTGLESTYLTSSKQKLKGQADYSQNIGLYATFGPVVRYKQIISLNYDYGPFNAALFYNWSSGYQDQNLNLAGNPRHVGAYETFDITSSYTLAKALKVTLGIRNIMDKAPPFSNQNAYFQVGYDPTIGDPHLRTYYARLSYTYK